MIDELSITANGQTIEGWQDIAVTRGIENFPSSFDLGFTEKFPDSATEVAITPATACQVKIGDDLVLTGYVDQYISNITPASHDVRITGRSKCEDLVDCSALFDQGVVYLADQTITQIATSLAKPFGITVSNMSDDGPPVLAVVVNLGETPYEIIEKVARWMGVLAYDGTDGNLILSRVGTTSMASGFAQGVNVQAASVTYRADQRFTDYYVVWQAVNVQNDPVYGLNQHGYAQDPSLKQLGRVRPHYIVSSMVDVQLGGDLGQKIAQWECNRRFGRSQSVTILTDSWRDQAGMLWQPNAYATVDIPAIKASGLNWIIASVTYLRDLQTGTTAQVTLMPPQAFEVEPLSLQTDDPDILLSIKQTADVQAAQFSQRAQ